MYLAGLIFAIIGWSFQAYHTLIKKDRGIHILLPAFYLIACVLFGINSYLAGSIMHAILDLVCALLTLLVTILLITQKRYY